jgi:hypothetical protein
VVLYGYETLSLILREEHRLRVFVNRVLKRIFGPKTDEVTGGLRKVHNEDLHNLYSSISRMIKSGRMRRVGHAARIEAKRNAHRIFVWKPEGKRSPGRRRNRWVDYIKIDLREIAWCGRDFVDLAQDRYQ